MNCMILNERPCKHTGGMHDGRKYAVQINLKRSMARAVLPSLERKTSSGLCCQIALGEMNQPMEILVRNEGSRCAIASDVLATPIKIYFSGSMGKNIGNAP